MDYYFTDFATLEYDSGATGIASCSDSTDYYLENGVIKRQIVSCSSAFTGSIQIYRGAMDTNMIAGNSYMIGLSSIVGDFLSNAKAYYVKLTLFSADSKLWEKYFPYFTQGDGLVTTKDDNSLEVFAT